MICPKCGGDVYVDSTMNMPDNSIYRHRKCSICKNVFGTIERVAEDQEQFGHDWYEQVKIRNFKRRKLNKGEKK